MSFQTDYFGNAGFSAFDFYLHILVKPYENKFKIIKDGKVLKEIHYSSIAQLEYNPYSSICIIRYLNCNKAEKLMLNITKCRKFVEFLQSCGVKSRKVPLIKTIFAV